MHHEIQDSPQEKWTYHLMHHFHSIAPIILLFHESRPEKTVNHTITSTAGSTS